MLDRIENRQVEAVPRVKAAVKGVAVILRTDRGTSVRSGECLGQHQRRRSDHKPSIVRVALYGAVVGGAALVVGDAVGSAIFPRFLGAQTAVLLTVGSAVSVVAGAVCDPVLNSLRKMERRVLRRWLSRRAS